MVALRKKDSAPPIPPPRSATTTLSSSPLPPNLIPEQNNIISNIKNNNSNNLNNSNSNNSTLNNRGDGANKIDIHVTVTVNPFSPGTLSDLKKQRALSRASQNSFTLSGAAACGSGNGSNNLFSLNAGSQSKDLEMVESAHHSELSASSNNNAGTFAPPASPTLVPRRFCGEPSDFIGKNDSRWQCCAIM